MLERTFIIAELGINHNGDMELARRSIRAAAEAGADAIKFQNYRTEDFLSDGNLSYEYISQGKTVVESQYTMFKRCELSELQWVQIKAWCDEAGIIFFSTPTNTDGVNLLHRLKSPLLKNGSDYLTHLPLIRDMGASGIPTLLSTGMASLEDIDDAVQAFREAGGVQFMLMLCTSAYPTPLKSINLRKLDTLRTTFNCPVGFSDHSQGILACLAAVARGVSSIEKHFTLDRNLPGPDHRFSMDPDELAELVCKVREVETCLGSGAIIPSSAEVTARTDYRLSCVTRRTIPAGEPIASEDIVFQRPGSGWAPKFAERFIGRKASTTITAFTQLDFNLFEEQPRLPLPADKNTQKVTLRPASMEDEALLLQWRNDPFSRSQILDSHEVSPSEHHIWLKNTLQDPNRILYIVLANLKPMGMVRADQTKHGYELSWNIAPEARGHGIGKAALHRLVQLLAAPVCAHILAENTASIRIANSVGMQLVKKKDKLLFFASPDYSTH